MEALNPKTLANKYSPKLAAYLNDPKTLVSSLNPLVMIAIGVVTLSMIVGLFSLCSTKLKDKLPARLIKIIEKIKSFFIFNVIISSLQTSYLDLWISTYT